ncbi:hypothetical protein BUZ85_18645, partial [Mammaliicoccus sciuri]
MSEGKDENVSYDGANTLGDTPTDEVINSQSNGDLNKDTTEIQSATEENQNAETVETDIADANYRELADHDTSELMSSNNE